MSDLSLRPYQITDIGRLRAAYAGGARAPIYQLPTGGGKTVVFSHVIRGATDKGRRTAVVAHRRELIGQASDKLASLGVPHGIMAAGQDRDHDAPVQVCSIQSIIRRLDSLPQFDFLVADEAHHARADTWAAFLGSQPRAKLLGVTATPARTDGKGLGIAHGGLFDAIICGPTVADLQAKGFLAPSKCYIPAQIDTTGLRKVAGDFNQGELADRAKVVTGDAVSTYRRLASGRSAIAFCVTVEHAESVAESFRAAGLRAACVHGSTPKDRRDSLIAGLGDGSLDVLTSCDLISEGLDVPSVGACILLRPTSSLILCLQQIGRGMRPKADGSPLIVLDHAGNTMTHGLPEEDRVWTLAGVEPKPKGPARISAEGENLGRGEREVETVAGELVEAKPDPDRRWRRMSFGEFKKHPRTLAQIHAFSRAKGYKPGWAFYYERDQRLRFG